MLVDHRDQLSSRRVQTVNRLHRLLAELTPGKAKKDLTALLAKAILASVRPRDVAGKTRRQVAADELADLIAIETKVKALTQEIKAIVKERGSNLVNLPGVAPVVAARILADVGDVTRFADRHRFASWTLRISHFPDPHVRRYAAQHPAQKALTPWTTANHQLTTEVSLSFWSSRGRVGRHAGRRHRRAFLGGGSLGLLVANHRVEDVGASTCQAEQGGAVTASLGAFAVVVVCGWSGS